MDNNQNNGIVITPEEYDEISNIQQQILEKIAADESVEAVLNTLCSLAESLLPNSVATIMMIDKKTGLLNVLCAPSVPQSGLDALTNLQPGPHGGSCGNAVFNNEPQFVYNTFEDPRWDDLRQVAYDFNLCSCWSMPIKNKQNNSIGSFALSSFEHRLPTAFHQKLLEIGASIVNIVLNKHFTEQRIQLFSAAIDNSAECVLITDINNHIVEVNAAFENVYGYKETEVLGKNPSFLASGIHDEVFYQKMWRDITVNNKWSGEIVNKHADGKQVSHWMSISVINDGNGQLQNYLSIISDLTELKIAQDKIIDMAFYDSVTHLYNKTHLEQQLLTPNSSYSLILLNINNFSYINTAYGFEIGDKLLVEISTILRRDFKAINTYRLNSDEFALLFDEQINIEAQIKHVQKYFHNTLLSVDDISFNISFTYGAAYGEDKLLRNSALALKQAKELGKNRYHIFDKSEESINHSQRKLFILANNMLHKALEEGTITPFFQGIYDNRTKQISKYEVLARIIDNGKVIPPSQFLKSAQLSGLLPDITKAIIDKAFQVMSAFNYKFSINITESDLSQHFLIDYLDEKSEQYNIAPERVILEILEGVSSIGKKNHINQLRVLKSRGYALAIDDFGTEYSNFERILSLDIDFLKIDAKYIKDIDVNSKSYEITRAITYFAKNANILCIAEFVHNESVQKVIEALGIEYSQGYYFSEPSPTIN